MNSTDKTAISSGRTVVPDDNLYLREIVPIAEQSACVKHAILSLSASYILDFKNCYPLQKRGNYHHKKAIVLLQQELRKDANHVPGEEFAIVAAVIIIGHNEVSSLARTLKPTTDLFQRL